jgi:methyl-accepting chemotaxis protein
MTAKLDPLSPSDSPLADEGAFYRHWIAQAAEVCERAARGDLEARLLRVPGDGDLGRMLLGINHLLDMTDAFVRESQAAMQHAAAGKFFRLVVLRGMLGSFKRAAETGNAATDAMARQATVLAEFDARRRELSKELEAVISTLASSATEVRATAESLASMAGKTTTEATVVASAAERTSGNLDRVAHTSRHMSETFARVDRQTGECAALTEEAVRQARGAAPVMQNLSEASQKVGGVVKLISRIAGQTNLLALNASIEAARSGDAGKGFGVVASEVKDLARQTASATDQIADQIQKTQGAAGQVSGALAGITSQINHVSEISKEIAGSVEQQRTAAAEIDSSTQRVAEGMHEITRSIQAVSDVARQTSECSSQLVLAADELSRQSESLRLNLGNFLADIRN